MRQSTRSTRIVRSRLGHRKESTEKRQSSYYPVGCSDDRCFGRAGARPASLARVAANAVGTRPGAHLAREYWSDSACERLAVPHLQNPGPERAVSPRGTELPTTRGCGLSEVLHGRVRRALDEIDRGQAIGLVVVALARICDPPIVRRNEPPPILPCRVPVNLIFHTRAPFAYVRRRS